MTANIQLQFLSNHMKKVFELKVDLKSCAFFNHHQLELLPYFGFMSCKFDGKSVISLYLNLISGIFYVETFSILLQVVHKIRNHFHGDIVKHRAPISFIRRAIYCHGSDIYCTQIHSIFRLSPHFKSLRVGKFIADD